MLRVIRRPAAVTAAILGLILGLGCWTKGVFTGYAVTFLLILLIAKLAGRIPWRHLVICAAVYLALFVPYAAAISWSYGQFTLGATGELNYAFHVNHMPHWANWQGGPAEFGSPIHSSTKMLDDLPVYAFGEPFKSTYPPYNNLSYWYRGSRHFFSFKNQLLALGKSLYTLAKIVKAHRSLWAFAAVLLAIGCQRDWRRSALRGGKALWPLYLLVLLAVIPYLLTHIEDRYLGGILLVAGLLPLTLLLDPALNSRRLFLTLVMGLYLASGVAELYRYDGWAIKAALQRRDFHRDPQWKLAAALGSYGLREGDAVAVIGGRDANFICSWAYVARLRIVAEFGALPWRVEPWDRWPLDRPRDEAADQDWGRVFWSLPAEQRQRAVEAFQRAGAQAIVCSRRPVSRQRGGCRQPIAAHGSIVSASAKT